MKSKLLFLFVLICANSWLHSTTWHIKQDGTGNFTTIQAGINASVDADTVLIYPGTYYENINYNGKNITVASLELTTGDPQYISQTVIDGQRLSSCVAIISGETDACLRGLTITNGQGEDTYPLWSGGITIWGDYPDMIECDIINCVIKKNYAHHSAGLYIRNSISTLSGLSIRDNIALNNGGGMTITDHSQITFDYINKCSIYNNFSAYSIEIMVETIYFNELTVIVDTFTVAEPTSYFARCTPLGSNFIFNFDILHYIVEPIDHEMYVSPDGDDNNSGLTVNEPLKTINLAVRNIASNPNDPNSIYLSAGVYSHDNNQLLPIGCKAYVNIIGENIANTVIDGEESMLFYASSGYQNSIIRNITFQNSHYPSSSVLVSNCDNICFENIEIQNCIITNIGAAINSATAGGNIQLIDVTVNNTQTQDGGNTGAWFNSTTSFKATNCTFSNNSCTGSRALSAGLYAMSSGDIIIDNCKFINNSATSTESTGYASALLCTDYNDEMGNVFINNCLFHDNVVNYGKSTIYAKVLNNDVLTFSNNTLINNDSPYGIEFQGNINCRNNILRNIGDYEISLFDLTGQGIISEIDISNCNILGGESAIYNENGVNIVNWLEGNIDEDPLFLLLGDDPYQLTEFSPCIDTGTPDTTGLFLPPWDLLQNHRVWDGDNNGNAIIDMGSYEFGAEPYVEVTQNLIHNTQYLLTNYPNPFNPETKIVFDLPESGKVKLEIYNIKGQKVKTLLDCYMSPGRSEMIWNGRGDNSKRVSSGVYFYRLQTPTKILTKKMLLLR